MKNKHDITIKLDIFQQELYVFVGKWEDCKKNIDEYLVEGAELDYSQPPIMAKGYYIDGLEHGWSSVIWLEKFDMAMLAHEMIHFLADLEKWIGLKDEETKAYIIQYVIEQVNNYMVSLGKQSKPKKNET
jgi:hypothetical protein